MKKIRLFFVVSLLLLLLGCEEEDLVKEQLEKDIAKIEKYLEENNLTAESTSSGLHYIIEEQGTGGKPNVYSLVSVNYTGYLLDGTVFDQGSIVLELYNLIPGWQEGIPLFNKGGYGKLFIPSSLGYGAVAKPNIPANSVLIFDIRLIDFR
jgi:FKBP-type peptidyl-prolyl cis-trans isomerase FkpA